MTPRHERIEKILSQALSPLHLEIDNESQNHAGPATESHFKILVVSEVFSGLSRLDRQRKVNELMREELATGLHALTQRLLSPGEWEEQRAKLDFVSPACAGKRPTSF